MNGAQTFYDQHASALWLVLLVFVLLVAAWIAFVHLRTRRLTTRLDDIFNGASSDNVSRMLADYLREVRHTSGAVNRIKLEHDEIAKVMPTAIRHVGLVRFSPFHDTGGDQSFTLALLDGKTNGVVITALHSRSDSRLYAKPIEHGRSEYTLTPEEGEAMDRALGRTKVPVSV